MRRYKTIKSLTGDTLIRTDIIYIKTKGNFVYEIALDDAMKIYKLQLLHQFSDVKTKIGVAVL